MTTGEQKEVRYELMRPAELIRRREACPLAYLPLGPIEWHGWHNPSGLDGIKAHELCLRAARKGAGWCFPWCGMASIVNLIWPKRIVPPVPALPRQ